MEVRRRIPGIGTPPCGLCRKPLHWWCADWPQVTPQEDPVGFLSMWWSCFTQLSSQGCPAQREWAHKYRCLTDQARKRSGPTSEILVQGLRRWPRPPRGLEGLQHEETLYDSIPSPWHTHPWSGEPLRDAPTPIGLWRMATWSWVHTTGRFRSEHLRQWTACLWPEISWDALLDWVRAPGITDLGTYGTASGSDGGLRGGRIWRTRFRDTYCHVHLQTNVPVESWARHPPQLVPAVARVRPAFSGGRFICRDLE